MPTVDRPESRTWPFLASWALKIVMFSVIAGCGDSNQVLPPPAVAAVQISPIDDAILVGASVTLRASTLDESGAVLEGRAIQWASAEQAVATITAAGVVTAHTEGTATISATSEGKLARVTLQVVRPHPLPVAIELEPARLAAGASVPVLLLVRGTDFSSQSRILLDGVAQPTDFITPTMVRATVDPGLVAGVGTYAIVVETPAPGGGRTTPLTLSVEAAPVPTITELEPRQITAGWPGAFTLTIRGTGFSWASVVRWDGIVRPSTYVSETTLQLQVAPADVATARDVAVTVETPAPGGGTAKATFPVHAIPVARVTVQTPWGGAWTWTRHGVSLVAVATDALGRELSDRRATWAADDESIVRPYATGDRDASAIGVAPGQSAVAATIDGVRAERTVRVLAAPHYDLVFETGTGDNRRIMWWDLTTGAAADRLRTTLVAFSPAPSPDGNFVAFAGVPRGAGANGNVDLYVATRDGATRPLATSDGFDGDPAWSPSGRQVAFTSSRDNGTLNVFVLDVATGTTRRLTATSSTGGPAGSGFAARFPTWSPDGTMIAYSVQDGTGSSLWVMNADGSSKRRLTIPSSADDLEPFWSADGSAIIFSRVFRSPERAQVMSVAPDGTGLTGIDGRNIAVAATPAMSPDGLWLATSAARGDAAGAVYAFSFAFDASPRVVVPMELGGGRLPRWIRRQ